MNAERMYLIYESFYESEIDNDISIEPELLRQNEIKSYIIRKIVQKSTNYPEHLTLNFKKAKDMQRFDRNLTGEIKRQFLNIVRAYKTYKYNRRNKTEYGLKRAVAAYMELKNSRFMSLNKKIGLSSDEFIELVPDRGWETYPYREEPEESKSIKIKPKYNKRIQNNFANFAI